jgi:hypothetical protein
VNRCSRVEPWIVGWSWVKFTDYPEPVRQPHLAYRHCPEEATVEVMHEGLRFCWCATHAATPTCGVSLLHTITETGEQHEQQ